MTCPKCGLTIEGSAKMCPRCLTKIPASNQNSGADRGDHPSPGGRPPRRQAPNPGYQPPYTAALNNPESPVYWTARAFKKYAVFEGRARRKEYWFFVLFNSVVSVALSLIGGFNLWDILIALFTGNTYLLVYMGARLVVYSLYNAAVLIPSLAVGARRLHDTGRSGFYLLLVLIPLAGAVLLIIYLAADSQPGDNLYGPNPK